jgi:2-dehydro-3-deoxy-D-arabinonate dehydratase
MIAGPDEQRDLAIHMCITRGGRVAFEGETRTSQLKRSLEEIVSWLGKELIFPKGVFLMTGTGIVPPDAFTLQPGDSVRIDLETLTLENSVAV